MASEGEGALMLQPMAPLASAPANRSMKWVMFAFLGFVLWMYSLLSPNEGVHYRMRKQKAVTKMDTVPAKGSLTKVIAVVGAGGPSGFECVRRLLLQGVQVRAVVRNPAKYEAQFNSLIPDSKDFKNLQITQGDVADEESLVAAFAGCRGVIFAASSSSYVGAGGPYQVDYLGVLKTAKAAAATGVQHIVLITSMLVNPSNRFHPIRIILNNFRWSLMDYKYEGEQALRNSGMPYTIVRPGGLVGGEGQRPAPRPFGSDYILASGPEGDLGTARTIHRADLAAVVCEALSSDDAVGKTVEVVSRPRHDGDPSFEERLKELFKGVPADV